MEIKVTKIKKSRIAEVDFNNLKFGEALSDHMFSMEYKEGKWVSPEIIPFGAIEIFPSLCALHYGQIVFEGLKAFYTKQGTINIFRPEKYHKRMNKSCQRLCMPEMDFNVFISGIKELVTLDKAWIPKKKGSSLYIRPFVFASDNFIGVHVSKNYRFLTITSPVGAYYKEGLNPTKLITSTRYVRSVRGGSGDAKIPGNYAPTLLPAQEAQKKGYTQVIWLDGIERKFIEEVGTSNIFFLIGDELITPPLEGTILDGVTRDCVIQLAENWKIKIKERKISIDEVISASQSGSLKECFATGTAAVISSVGEIAHKDTSIIINDMEIGDISRKLYDEITGIQCGNKADKFGWRYLV